MKQPILFALLVAVISNFAQAQDQPAEAPMLTRWGKLVNADNAWREYPRPAFARESWTSLNGQWDLAFAAENAARPGEFPMKIVVPFAPESTLSGVRRVLEPTESLWYRRTFPHTPKPGRRTLLNFEAVDYQATVWVNGKEVGQHIGGNLPFSFDITDAIKAGDNELIVRAIDRTNAPGSFQLRGKQVLKPQGIWYTRVSGIWQSVWLEEVPVRRLADVHIVTKYNPATITITPTLAGPAGEGELVRVTAVLEGKTVATAAGADKIVLSIPSAKLWSPARPNLYDLKIELLDGTGNVVDSVSSYAGIREVGQARDAEGHLRFTLNGQVIFHWGPLDQGWWPDGLLTPPSDAALKSDVEFLKAAGFNMIRKHIKVEPRRFYYHCDRLGIMLWQDQPSGGVNPKWTRMAPDPKDAEWPDTAHQQYMAELKGMVDTLRNHPCIVIWVPFNEAWGQHRTVEVGKWIAAYDPTRQINIASGGNYWAVGHVADHHEYPNPNFPLTDARFKDMIKVVGEFGGHGWPVKGHLWNEKMRNWGYGGLPKTIEEWQARYTKSMDILADLKSKGIAAGVYTQTTDVEGEINGLLTYDREVQKLPAADLKTISKKLGEEIER